jgi:homoserine acetyltransferase
MGVKSLLDWIHPPAGESGFEIWDAEDILTMGRMWQAGDVGSIAGNGGDYRKALGTVTARVMVMPSKTDQYFVPEDGETEAKYLKNGKFNPIPTIWGHIGGGGANPVDTEWMNEEISQFLKEGLYVEDTLRQVKREISQL